MTIDVRVSDEHIIGLTHVNAHNNCTAHFNWALPDEDGCRSMTAAPWRLTAAIDF
jgi:hypothetical protein